jgi:hypothetical protein
MIIINQMGTVLFIVEFPRKFNVMQHNILKVQIAGYVPLIERGDLNARSLVPLEASRCSRW